MTGIASAQSARPAPIDGGRPGGDHIVQRGDTLWDIAQQNGVSLAALERANPQIANPDLIRPGEHVYIPGGSGDTGTGGVTGTSGQPNTGPHANAAAIAESYLGQNASALEGNRSDKLPMQAGISSHECCANFVSAVLTQAGQLPGNLHTNSVAQLNSTLRARGWTEVPASQARPGDVVIMQGGGISHTEMVAQNGRMIGSNNVNPDGSQKVSYNNLSYALAHGGKILRAPAGVGGTQSTGGTQASGGTSGTGPTGTGSLGNKQAQAVSYFENHGWTHAQASGIVANLTRESQLSPTAVGDGGSAYGMGQWHPDRQAEFQRFTGHSIRNSTFAEQLAFVNHELGSTERGAGQRLHGATTADQAGAIVSRYYERPGDANGEANARGTLARQIAAATD